MKTLVVTASHDYSQDNLNGITEIDFDNTSTANVTFAASQFDNTHISTSVHIVINNGSSEPFNDIYITHEFVDDHSRRPIGSKAA